MEIRDLAYLEASVIAGTFTRAAKSLGVNASTISRRVGRFEDELGLALFERAHSGIRLTNGGKEILSHIRRALAELDAIRHVGDENGTGAVGEVRLAVRMPPVGVNFCSLLSGWREKFPKVILTLTEMNEWEIQTAMWERRIDAALVTTDVLWPDAASVPLFRERLLAAIPMRHLLAKRKALNWESLRNEVFLVQGWDNSQSARDLYASLIGQGCRFQVHPGSKQCVLALVAAGFGVTLATESQTEVTFPGIVYRPICERDAFVQVALVWSADAEDPAVGRFVAFMRDEAGSPHLF